jgi:hypothetical protein
LHRKQVNQLPLIHQESFQMLGIEIQEHVFRLEIFGNAQWASLPTKAACFNSSKRRYTVADDSFIDTDDSTF